MVITQLTLMLLKFAFNNYTWFEQIDFVLKEYFKQMNRMLNNKTTYWRAVIDIHHSKFECIMRDILDLYGGTTVKMPTKNDTVVLLLEDLLKSDPLKQFFNQDDINLCIYIHKERLQYT